MKTENGFLDEDTGFLSAALRDSRQAKRPVLLCNGLLAKHIPCSPRAALDYFRRLGTLAAETCQGEKVLVVGFAETATAVGAAVAAEIPGAVYCHTSREPLSCARLVVDFLEEHSHAVNQALYLRQAFRDLRRYDRIVFVEDEITTGKTILNFLRALREREEIGSEQGVTVAALVFNACDETVFSAFNACCCHLTRLDGFLPVPAGRLGPTVSFSSKLEEPMSALAISGAPDPRLGVWAEEYRVKCAVLAHEAAARIGEGNVTGKRVLVLGTEECMYPALAFGAEIEGVAAHVRSHSTTRTPILPQNGEGYPIRARYAFPSLYDEERTTYLYNVDVYDTVVIVTDAPSSSGGLLRLLRSRGNENVYFISMVSSE
ncbi:MAG: phosphoribosyltransferase family protein [Synergistaceae bacterium]|nr:phosphoribosyltransferase family protein [Synergistaceae bacterium]